MYIHLLNLTQVSYIYTAIHFHLHLYSCIIKLSVIPFPPGMTAVDIEFWQTQIKIHKEDNHKSCPQGRTCNNAECEMSHGAETSSWLPLNVRMYNV